MNIEVRLIKTSIKLNELEKIASAAFEDNVKAIINIKQEIMAIGGEL